MGKILVGLAALACVAGGAAHCYDILYYIDVYTGFCIVGSHWLRYGALALLLALLFAAGLALPAKAVPIQRGRPCLGAALLLAALGFAVAGALGLTAQLSQTGIELMAQRALAVLELGTALWLGVLGLAQFSAQPKAFGAGVLPALAGNLSLYLLTILRFVLHQSSVVRVSYTLHVFSAVAALLFAASLLRLGYLPDALQARTLCRQGLGAFLLCFCLETPRAVLGYLVGSFSLPELTQSLALGLLGLAGLAAALGSLQARLPEEKKAEEKAGEA